uniref:Fibronectin type-III domain-containing protein n=1 Tax=Monopterus albus TaxID=43700 RepID=A0A3Q3KDE1_MONAL
VSADRRYHANLCNVIPKDLYIEMGSDIEVLCQTSCASGKIFWTLNSRPIDESLSNVINSSLTVLSLRTFTHHNATLQCHSANTQQILGGTTIRTYSKTNIADFTFLLCIFPHVDVVPHLFTCKWEHQMNSSLKIHYTVLYASLLRPSYTEICSSYVTTCTSKDIDLSDKVHFFGNASVIVRAKATAWEAYSNPYEFDHYDILQMIRPEVTVTAFPDHLLVEWTRSPSTRTCHCQVKYGKVKTYTVWEYTIQSVESCTHYNILVRCALDKAPWSDWSRETTVLTKLNKSDVKLHLWRKVAEPKKNAIRNVHIMWTVRKPLITPYKNYMTGANSTGSLCYSSPCDIDVNQDAHRINLTVFHGEILLTEDSVYVPATVESLLKVTDLQTSNLKGVILVSWKAPLQPVSGYMIDWTHNGNQYYWKESKYTNTRLLDLLDKKPYNITVTPLFGDKTGHGTQALQICSRVGNPGNVTIISVEAKDKSAILSWSTRSQEECSGAVINYTVFYGTQKGPTLNVTVDYTKQDLCLKDLDPDTQYSVYVKATALTGTSKSSERLFKTKRYGKWLVNAPHGYKKLQWKKFREKPVPNPGHSSVALWSSPSYQKVESRSNITPMLNWLRE